MKAVACESNRLIQPRTRRPQRVADVTVDEMITFLAILAMFTPIFGSIIAYSKFVNVRREKNYRRFAEAYGLDQFDFPKAVFKRVWPSVEGVVDGVPLRLYASVTRHRSFQAATMIAQREHETRVEVRTTMPIKAVRVQGIGPVTGSVQEHLKMGHLSEPVFRLLIPLEAEPLIVAYCNRYPDITLFYGGEGQIDASANGELSNRRSYDDIVSLAEILLALAK
jgi:hypothetical protein